MDNRELENRIRESYRNIAPDTLESVLTECDTQKGRTITMQENKKKLSVFRYRGSLVAAMLLIVCGLGVYRFRYAVSATVMLDVNPGIGITVNRNEKVLEVKPYNEDARTVIGNMDFSGSSLEVTVNALIGSMLRNGYISEDANSVLISVDSRNPADGQSIQTRLMNEINDIMESENLSGAVLGQYVQGDSNLQKPAEQYGITVGKAKMIDEIIRQNTLYTFEELVPLTINELNLISESGVTRLENIESIGTASTSAYIGEQSAKAVAYQRAKIGEAAAKRVRCELDWENGNMIYEVDFDADGHEYEVEIDAKSGRVVGFNCEKDDDYRAPQMPKKTPEQEKTSVQPSAAAVVHLDETAAKQAAFRHAEVDEKSVTECSCEWEHNRGNRLYEVEFKANGYEFDYDIDAVTGEVIRFSKEKDDDYRSGIKASSEAPKQNATRAETVPVTVEMPEQTAASTESTGDIGEAAAKAAALNHAGVSGIREYECERDIERGKLVYEISFEADGYEYDYEIAGADGRILKSEKERD